MFPATGGALERHPGQLRLVPPQHVTEFSEGLAVTGIKLLPVIPGEHVGHRSRQAGIGFQQIPDAGLQRLPGVPAAGAVDHRRQRRRDAGIRFRVDENQPGQFAAHGLRPGGAGAGVSQHLVAVCLRRLRDQPRRQIYPPASRPRIRLIATCHDQQQCRRI